MRAFEPMWAVLDLKLKETRGYSPLRGLTFSSCGGLWHSDEAFFCPLGKKRAFHAVCAFLGHLWCSVVTFGSTISNPTKKTFKKSYKIKKNTIKNIKNVKKCQKLQKSQKITVFSKNLKNKKYNFSKKKNLFSQYQSSPV